MNDMIKSSIFKARERFKNYWNNNEPELIVENCYAIATKLEIYNFLISYVETCGADRLYGLFNKDIQKIVDEIFQRYLKVDDNTYEIYESIIEDINNG